MPVANCVTQVDLERLCRGSLPETEAAVMEEHVLHCSHCLEKLKAVAGSEDNLAGLLRQHTPEPDFAASSVLANLMQQLKALGPSPTSPVPQGAAMLSLTCTTCRKKLTVKDILIGKKVKCPGCGQVLTVPAPVAVPAGDCTLPPNPQPSNQAPASGHRSPHSALEATVDVKPADPERTSAAIPPPAEQDKESGGDDDHNLTHFLSPPQAADELGRLGKYRILKILGRGGMGVVYKAEDPVLKRAVAIKAMLPNMVANTSAGKRFLREAQTMAAVENDYIVRIHDVAEERGVPFLAMEFLKGEPLDVRIERDGKLSAAETVRIGREIAEGLQAAHERGLIHRDIKPGNIWLEAARGRVKILDFGLARSAEPESGLTQQGAILGTPAYMAPEQGRGDPVDARSDLFSLGVVLYRLCSGKQPFHRADTISTLMAVAMDNPPPPVQLNSQLPPHLSELVMQLLQKNPDSRPASAAVVVEMLHVLEAQLGGAPRRDERTVSLPSPTQGQAAPANRRRRLWVAIAAGLVLLIGGLLAAQIIVQIRDKNGKVVGEHAVPEGGEVRLIQPKQDKAASIDAWLKEVAALPAEKQVEAVAAKLKQRNPGFDGKLTHKVEGRVVTEVRFSPAGVTDLSPVRALAGLKVLNFGGRFGANLGGPADLSPLKDMKLTSLSCDYTPVSDLSPLKDMKLTELACSGTKVADLSPLKGMQLTGLSCSYTPVSELSPLKGMPLKTLFCNGVKVSDLSPLKGMPLKDLACEATKVTDLSPLKGLPLTGLSCWGAPMSDLSPLKDLKLTGLDCRATRVADLSPLKGMPLKGLACDFKPERDAAILRSIKTLEKINDKPVAEFWKEVESAAKPIPEAWFKDVAALPADKQVEAVAAKLKERNPGWDGKVTHKIDNAKVRELELLGTIQDISPVRALTELRIFSCRDAPLSDLSPLKGMKLTNLSCGNTKVSDLSPLTGMPLTDLNVNKTQVSDLSPLTGMPLTVLHCYGTPVSDLSPLKGMKLTSLGFSATKVSDLSPLKDMPLQGIECDFKPERDTEILRSIKTLQKINGKPAADFWKEVDIERSAFDAWLKQVAALPAAKQVEAVAAKLKERNPGFDGKVTPTINDGIVTGVEFLTDQVTDISAVRALTGLRMLNCSGTLLNGRGRGRLADLSPLKDMQLLTLECSRNRVVDLSPLKGMPLTALYCPGTSVADLSPLKGMALTSLNCGYMPVADLSPLKDMKLTFLSCVGTKVADLSPLKGMKLWYLHCGSTQVSDLSPLKGMKLTSLLCHSTPVADLSPLKGMKLMYLDCQGTKLADLSPLKDMPLRELHCDFKPERDAAILRSLKTLEKINKKPAAEFWKRYDKGEFK